MRTESCSKRTVFKTGAPGRPGGQGSIPTRLRQRFGGLSHLFPSSGTQTRSADKRLNPNWVLWMLTGAPIDI